MNLITIFNFCLYIKWINMNWSLCRIQRIMLGFTANYFLHIKFANHWLVDYIIRCHQGTKNIIEIGLLHKCCDEKNIRVKDIFFWTEQYLHDNVGCGQWCANIFSQSDHANMHYESLKHANIQTLLIYSAVCPFLSSFFISKYIIICILIIINAMLMSFRWMAELMV